MNRAIFLYMRVNTLASALGDGPWLEAAEGRLRAATGLEPPALPWYSQPGDRNVRMVAYMRESGRAGYDNRGARRAAYRKGPGLLGELRRALKRTHAVVTSQ